MTFKIRLGFSQKITQFTFVLHKILMYNSYMSPKLIIPTKFFATCGTLEIAYS